jgi:hypothetical protein
MSDDSDPILEALNAVEVIDSGHGLRGFGFDGREINGHFSAAGDGDVFDFLVWGKYASILFCFRDMMLPLLLHRVEQRELHVVGYILFGVLDLAGTDGISHQPLPLRIGKENCLGGIDLGKRSEEMLFL